MIAVLAAAKASAADPNDPAKAEALLQQVANARNLGDEMTSQLPGQREVDAAVRAIAASSDFSSIPPCRATVKECQDDFMQAARALAQACQQLQQAVERGPEELALAATLVQDATVQVMDAGRAVAGKHALVVLPMSLTSFA